MTAQAGKAFGVVTKIHDEMVRQGHTVLHFTATDSASATIITMWNVSMTFTLLPQSEGEALRVTMSIPPGQTPLLTNLAQAKANSRSVLERAVANVNCEGIAIRFV